MELDIRVLITATFLALGSFLLIIASIGVIRFPDLYTRMHAAGKADTLGQALILLGLISYTGIHLNSVKLLFIMILFFVVNPTASHFLVKAAYIKNVQPWTKQSGVRDESKTKETN